MEGGGVREGMVCDGGGRVWCVMEGGGYGVMEGGGHGVMEGGWCDGGGEAVVGTHISPPRFHWCVLVFVRGWSVVVLVVMMVLMLVVVLVVVATSPTATWPLQFRVRERRGG